MSDINGHQNMEDSALEAWQQAIELDPTNLQLLEKILIFYDRRKDLGSATRAIRKYLEPILDDFHATCELGIHLEEGHRIDAAIKVFIHAHKLQPDDIGVVRKLDELLRDQNSFEELGDIYRSYLRVVPNDSEVLSDLGGVLVDLDRIDEAIEKLHLSLKLNPNDKVTYNNLGFAYWKAKKLGEALQHFQHALKLDPMYTKARIGLSTVLQKQKNYRRGIAELEKGIQIDPQNTLSYLQPLFEDYVAMGDNEKLLEVGMKIIEHDVHLPGNYLAMGMALYASNEWLEAAKAFRKCVELKPDAFDARILLAEILWALDRKDESIAEYHEILIMLLESGTLIERISILGDSKNEVFYFKSQITKNTIIIKRIEDSLNSARLEFEFDITSTLQNRLADIQFTPPAAHVSLTAGKRELEFKKYEFPTTTHITEPITTLEYDNHKYFLYKQIEGETLSEILSKSVACTNHDRTVWEYRLLAQSLKALAGFHIKFWNILDTNEFKDYRIPLLNYELMIKNRFANRFKIESSKFIEQINPLLSKLKDMQKCVCHGDFHSDNVFFRSVLGDAFYEIQSPSIIDFELACVASPLYDVSYFLAQSPIDIDFNTKCQLIEHYVECFKTIQEEEEKDLISSFDMSKISNSMAYMTVFVNLCISGTAKEWADERNPKYMQKCRMCLEQALTSLTSINSESLFPLQETIKEILISL